MTAEQEVHARHILVARPRTRRRPARSPRTRKAAIFAEHGEDQKSKELTEDPSGKANGGDLGYFTKDQMVPEFADVAFKLGQGPGLRSGEDPVRLARHQGRGQAHQAGAGVRQGQGADRAASSRARRRPIWSPSCAPSAKIEQHRQVERAEGRCACEPRPAGEVRPSRSSVSHSSLMPGTSLVPGILLR